MATRDDLGRSSQEFANVTLGLPEEMSCFSLGLANGWRDNIDPGNLLRGPEEEAIGKRKIKKAFVHIVDLSSRGVEGDDSGTELGLALLFLVGGIDAVQVGIALLPGYVQVSSDIVEDLSKPPLTGEFLGADCIVAVDVCLLELDPVMAEAAPEKMSPSNGIL